MDLRNTKIRGGTLIESVTAMTLVLLITALVFSFFVKINTNSILVLELEAFLTAKLIVKDIINEHSYYDDEWASSKFHIKKKVTSLDEVNGVYHILLELKDQKERTVISYKTIIVDYP